MMQFLSYLKSRIRRHKTLESILFFIYTRFTFSFRFLQAKLISFLIIYLRSLVLKKEIAAISVYSSSTILEMKDGNKFYWDAADRQSLLGMGLNGTWEHDDTEYLKKIIKKGDAVIDIGANYGFHTVLFSKLVGDEGKVYSFEPLNSMYKQLENNVILNSSQHNTTLEKYALGDRKGKATIYVPERMGRGAASLARRGKTVEKEVCEIITLDSYINNKIKKINFIKCDVEGAELLAFKGAKNVLKKYRPMIMVEVTRGSSEAFAYTPEILLDFLSRFGYEFYYVAGSRLLKIKPASIPYFHGNCFAFSRG